MAVTVLSPAPTFEYKSVKRVNSVRVKFQTWDGPKSSRGMPHDTESHAHFIFSLALTNNFTRAFVSKFKLEFLNCFLSIK